MYIKSVLHNNYISLHEVGWVFSLVILMIDGWPQIEKVLRFESLQICSQFQSVTSSQANEFLHLPSPPQKKTKKLFLQPHQWQTHWSHAEALPAVLKYRHLRRAWSSPWLGTVGHLRSPLFHVWLHCSSL